MISETKLDSFFPIGKFRIRGCSEPYRFDRNGNGDGILVSIRKDVPTKLIDSKMRLEWFFIELILRGKKSAFVLHYLNEISRDLDFFTS